MGLLFTSAALPLLLAQAASATGVPTAVHAEVAALAPAVEQIRAAGAAAALEKDPVNAYRDLLVATNELWFLLAGIRDKSDADRAAQRFAELVSQLNKMDEELVLMEDKTPEQESLDQLRYQIMDAYCSVDSEFGGLCRVRCYGSQELVDAFQSAVSGGMFDADELPLLEELKPFSAEEARAELARIRQLPGPDKELLDCLCLVVDAASARQNAPELARLAAQLRRLQPEGRASRRNFADRSDPAVSEASAPVESLLWSIRSEIVRIAALPGYSDEPFDAFSDTLDDVYAALGETHSEWFDDVFDESFRLDLDEAYRENNSSATTSN